ncbi:MAG: hypothetical protein ACTSPD_19585 [Promethearchaeota archaeon]
MISELKTGYFLVFLKFKCIELYKNYTLEWDAVKFENQDDYDLIPSEIYFITIINALNKKEAIKKGKLLFDSKCPRRNNKLSQH